MRGSVAVSGRSGDAVALDPGTAAYADPEEGPLTFTGTGEVFVAQPGAH